MCPHVTAQRAQHLRPHPQYRAVVLDGQFQLADVLPRVVGRDEMFGPVFRPLHRATRLHCREGHKEILRVELAPHSEPAAHVRLHEVNPMLRHLQQRRQHPPVVVRHLGLAPHRQLLPSRVV